MIKGLTTALVLVVPAGFTEQDRKLWLAVAYETIKDLPLDLLQRGIRYARTVADHPSKIVPAVISEVRDELARRRGHLSYLERALAAPEPEEGATAESDGPDFTAEEIRGLSPVFRKMALGQGWLTQEEIDAAHVEDE